MIAFLLSKEGWSIVSWLLVNLIWPMLLDARRKRLGPVETHTGNSYFGGKK